MTTNSNNPLKPTGRYRARPQSGISNETAQRVAPVLTELAEQGRLTPAEVVEAAKDPSSPLHDCFDWPLETAACNWWKQQAGCLIGAIEIEVVTPVTNTVSGIRAFHSLQIDVVSERALDDETAEPARAAHRQYMTISMV